MSITTPNIGIYIPAAGETNYAASFAQGMVNIDLHDHSGGPTHGVPIANSGIADGSITYNKLAANVVDTTTGLQINSGAPNQIQIAGLLQSIFKLVSGTGFIAQNGTGASARTLTQTATQILISNPAGVAGNPTFTLANPLQIGGVSFDAGANVLQNFIDDTSFSPNLAFGGSSVGITYSTNTAYYSRIGNIVFYSIIMVLSNKGAATGPATITDFPIAAGANAINMNFVEPGRIDLDPSYTDVSTRSIINTTTAAIIESGSNQPPFNIDNTYFFNTSAIRTSGFYIIA